MANRSNRPTLLYLLCLVISIASVACDHKSEGATGAGTSRSESISVASTTPLSSSSTPSSASASNHATPTPPRKLCEEDLAQPGRKLPKGTFAGVAATKEPRPDGRLVTDGDKWTWINFFAAWCAPCKEEMPRLRRFQEKLAANLDVVFISVDDDERQLHQFLDAQPQGTTGVRRALWLQPGKARGSWLTALHLKESPDLPAHVLVDRTGKIRCVAGGAIEDADFEAIASIVKR